MPGEGCLEVSVEAKNRYAKALDQANNDVKIQQDHISHHQAMIAHDTFRRNEYLHRMENNVPEDAPSRRIRS